VDSAFPLPSEPLGFERERRRSALAKIAARLRSEPDDVSIMLPFDEVVAALGRRSQRDAGLKWIPLDSIVGTVDRRLGQFDRAFRPGSADSRGRWERVAAARRRGDDLPPIRVYRIGELHFVEDGHHRVSVARSLGDTKIQAHVTEVRTALPAELELHLRDLPLKRHERLFHERVPLVPEARARIKLFDEWRYSQLAALVEAWGYRASCDRGQLLSRPQMAGAWFRDEYEPVVAALNEAGIGGEGTETERYLRVVSLRYLLLHTLDWSGEVVERLQEAIRPPERGDDTMVHRILKEME
jgi:hypothetical protein